jgi:hypothetical protein
MPEDPLRPAAFRARMSRGIRAWGPRALVRVFALNMIT